MRQTATYKTFQARWGLGVYFQLRWKEIVLPLEEALVAAVVGNERLSASRHVMLLVRQPTNSPLDVDRLEGRPPPVANACDAQGARGWLGRRRIHSRACLPLLEAHTPGTSPRASSPEATADRLLFTMLDPQPVPRPYSHARAVRLRTEGESRLNGTPSSRIRC
jgi:hypothetical protein